MTVVSRPDPAGNPTGNPALFARLRQGVAPVWQWFGTTLGYWERPVTILRHYQPADLLPDVMAGLTIAIVLLPQAIAYSLIAELPPQMGLYAAIVAAIIGALWGSSAHLHTGPTNAASLLVLSTLLSIAAPGTPRYLAAAGLLAVMVGVARLLMGLARLGVLVNFVRFGDHRFYRRAALISQPAKPDAPGFSRRQAFIPRPNTRLFADAHGSAWC
jgi:hypothetical protein